MGRFPIEKTSPATVRNLGLTTTKISVVADIPVPTRGPAADEKPVYPPTATKFCCKKRGSFEAPPASPEPVLFP